LQRRIEEANPQRADFDALSYQPSVAIVGFAVFSWLAATAWMRPLDLPDEGRYVGVAWEMVRSGNWLVPTLDAMPYFHKPPLFYWLTAIATWALGNNEWAARLPTLLSATGIALGLFTFLRRWGNGATALGAVVVLVTMPLFFAGAQFANLDALVAACISGTILCAADVVLAFRHQQNPRRSSLASAYVLAALGVLAKGLIGIALPALVVGMWLILLRDLRAILRLVWLPGVILFALIAVPWFAWMQARYPDFLGYFFIYHHVERFLGADFNGKQPFWFYGPLCVAATLPWSTFLPWTLAKKQEDKLTLDLRLLFWVWLTTILLFFSIPKSKLVGYVLPATPALAALVALALVHHAKTWIGSRINVMANAILAAFLCSGGVVGYAVYHRKGIEQLAAELRSQVRPGDQLLAISQYPFSLAFYLRATQPITVIDDWDATSILRKDNWRRELYEASKFDVERGNRLLLQPSQLPIALCSGRTWLFGSEQDFERLAGFRQVARSHLDVVWLAEPAMLHCPPTAQ
jgi:4-amino-4-deoxy-L-arabinose transferase-like glycosyltransferase